MGEDVVYESRGDGSTTRIWVTQDVNGDMQIAGQDVGAAPREFFGDSDYEYWVTIPWEHSRDITLELLRALAHRPPGGTTPIIEWLREHSIPFTTGSF